MAKVKVSVNYYHKKALDKIAVFAAGVKHGIFSHSNIFSSPPLSEEEVKSIIKNYNEAYSRYKGRRMSKAEFRSNYNALISMLDRLAVYVNDTVKGDSNHIGLSGFKPTELSNSSWLPPWQPQVKVSRSIELGEVYAESNKLVNAIYYGCIVFKNIPPENIIIKPGGKLEFSNRENFVCIDLTKSRKKEFRGLTSEVRYYFYFYAANANGVSALSDVKSIKCLRE